MTQWPGIWISLLRWRWWRDAGAEIARRAAVPALPVSDLGELAATRLRWRMQDIERVAKWMPRSRCLDRALCLAEWADQQRLPAELCIGVKRQGERIRAHAWVRSGDIIIDPDPLSTAQFLRLDSGVAGLEFDR